MTIRSFGSSCSSLFCFTSNSCIASIGCVRNAFRTKEKFLFRKYRGGETSLGSFIVSLIGVRIVSEARQHPLTETVREGETLLIVFVVCRRGGLGRAPMSTLTWTGKRKGEGFRLSSDVIDRLGLVPFRVGATFLSLGGVFVSISTERRSRENFLLVPWSG